MEYELERKIKLSTDSEYESLYKWALQEYDDKDEKVGSSQIPWSWGVDFRTDDLQYIRTIEIGKKSYSNLFSSDDEQYEDAKKEDEERRAEVSDNERITGTLHPTQFRWGEWQDDYCSLSMFGTKREIKEIRLDIRVSDSEEDESCHLWGSPSYTADFDFEERTEDDILFINVIISSDRFNQIAELIRDKKTNSCMVRLSTVSGFYSEWSPAVRADRIKVLCAGSDQAVELPDGCDIDPPRLGRVQEFSLTLSSDNKMDAKKTSELDDEIQEDGSVDKIAGLFGEEEKTENIKNVDDWKIAQIARNQVLLSKIRKLLWIIISLLVLIFLNLAS